MGYNILILMQHANAYYNYYNCKNLQIPSKKFIPSKEKMKQIKMTNIKLITFSTFNFYLVSFPIGKKTIFFL